MRLIWIIVTISAIFLILLWILTSNISAHTKKDLTLFQTIGRGIKNLQEQYRHWTKFTSYA